MKRGNLVLLWHIGLLLLMPTLTLAQTHIYWVDENGINRQRLDAASETEVVVHRTGNPLQVRYDAGNGFIYWTESGDCLLGGYQCKGGRVRRHEEGTLLVEDIARYDTAVPYALALDVGHGKVYWSTIRPSQIWRANVDGSMPELLVQDSLDIPKALALDQKNGKLYWADGSIDWWFSLRSSYEHIKRANLDGSGVEVFQVSGSDVEVDTLNQIVYWTAGSEVHQLDLLNATEDTVFTAPGRILDMEYDPDVRAIRWLQNLGTETGHGTWFLNTFRFGSFNRLRGARLSFDHAAGEIYWVAYGLNPVGDPYPIYGSLSKSDLDFKSTGRFAVQARPEAVHWEKTYGSLLWLDARGANFSAIMRSTPDGEERERLHYGWYLRNLVADRGTVCWRETISEGSTTPLCRNPEGETMLALRGIGQGIVAWDFDSGERQLYIATGTSRSGPGQGNVLRSALDSTVINRYDSGSWWSYWRQPHDPDKMDSLATGIITDVHVSQNRVRYEPATQHVYYFSREAGAGRVVHRVSEVTKKIDSILTNTQYITDFGIDYANCKIVYVDNGMLARANLDGTDRENLREVPFTRFALDGAPNPDCRAYSTVIESDVPVDDYEVAIFPMPFTDQATLALGSTMSGQVQVDVYDLLGRPISRLFNGIVSAGESHQIKVNAQTWPAGVYWIRVQGRAGVHTSSVVRLP